jgi:hypothetical protein
VQPLIPHSRSLGRNSQRESGDDIRLANASVRRQPDGSFVVSAGAAAGGSSGSSSSSWRVSAPGQVTTPEVYAYCLTKLRQE